MGYRKLCDALDISIAGGEAEFTRWGFRNLIGGRYVDILQPEVCGLGGITEFPKGIALAKANFVPVVNHVWGSAITLATNFHLLAALPDLPGGAHPTQPMLELDTTPNRFVDEILEEPLGIRKSVKETGGTVPILEGADLGVQPDLDFIRHFTAHA